MHLIDHGRRKIEKCEKIEITILQHYAKFGMWDKGWEVAAKLKNDFAQTCQLN